MLMEDKTVNQQLTYQDWYPTLKNYFKTLTSLCLSIQIYDVTISALTQQISILQDLPYSHPPQALKPYILLSWKQS